MTYVEWLDRLHAPFPRLSTENSRLTSPENDGYNCIAWAAESGDRWWWPDAQFQAYWPPGVLRAETLDAFAQAHATLGYVEQSDGLLRAAEN